MLPISFLFLRTRIIQHICSFARERKPIAWQAQGRRLEADSIHGEFFSPIPKPGCCREMIP